MYFNDVIFSQFPGNIFTSNKLFVPFLINYYSHSGKTNIIQLLKYEDVRKLVRQFSELVAEQLEIGDAGCRIFIKRYLYSFLPHSSWYIQYV